MCRRERIRLGAGKPRTPTLAICATVQACPLRISACTQQQARCCCVVQVIDSVLLPASSPATANTPAPANATTPGGSSPSLAAVIGTHPELAFLVQALGSSPLAAALASSPLTLFAPTNAVSASQPVIQNIGSARFPQPSGSSPCLGFTVFLLSFVRL